MHMRVCSHWCMQVCAHMLRTHARSRQPTHARTRSRTRTRTHTHTQIHVCSLTDPPALTHRYTYIYTCIQSHKATQPPSNTDIHHTSPPIHCSPTIIHTNITRRADDEHRASHTQEDIIQGIGKHTKTHELTTDTGTHPKHGAFGPVLNQPKNGIIALKSATNQDIVHFRTAAASKSILTIGSICCNGLVWKTNLNINQRFVADQRANHPFIHPWAGVPL